MRENPSIVGILKITDGYDLSEENFEKIGAVLPYMTSLMELSITNNFGLDEADVKSITNGFKHLTKLTKLELDENAMGDKCFIAITKALQFMPNLTEFKCRNCWA